MQHLLFFFFNDTATTEIYTLSLHDALPIFGADFFGVRVSGRSVPFQASQSQACLLENRPPIPGTDRRTAQITTTRLSVHPRTALSVRDASIINVQAAITGQRSGATTIGMEEVQPDRRAGAQTPIPSTGNTTFAAIAAPSRTRRSNIQGIVDAFQSSASALPPRNLVGRLL